MNNYATSSKVFFWSVLHYIDREYRPKTHVVASIIQNKNHAVLKICYIYRKYISYILLFQLRVKMRTKLFHES